MNRKVSESDFDSRRQFVETDFGQIAYVESGEGAAAVFLHGFPLNGYHWRGQLDALQDIRRCLAIDLMGLGYSELSADQDLSFPAQAQMVLQVMDRLAIRRFDLIGNDSGGAIAQIIAARAPDRVTSLIVTNCDVHDNWPPPTFSQTVGLAKAGRLGSALVELDQNIGLAQSDFGLGVGFEHREALTPEAVHMYVKPLLDNPLRQSQVDSFVNAMNCEQTTSIYDALSELTVPTCIIWGDDDIFFPPEWADWLENVIPGVVAHVKIKGGRLFFCEEKVDEVNDVIREFWSSKACEGACSDGRSRVLSAKELCDSTIGSADDNVLG